MNTESKGIYHWKLGDVALARVSQKTYARVRVVKDEKGLFYDDKVLGISGNEDGSITVTKELCYYVETCRTNHKFWLPYTSLHLAERSRPFYGNEKGSTKVEKTEVSPNKTLEMPQKRNIKEEHIMPMDERSNTDNTDVDLNITYENNHIPNLAEEIGKNETKYKEFVRRGKEVIFDKYLAKLQRDPIQYKNMLDYLASVNASTEDKFEYVIKKFVTVKEVENYLHSCWRYNSMHNSYNGNEEDDILDVLRVQTSPIEDEVTIHIPWCLVCGKTEELTDCPACPAAFHPYCKKEWLVTVIHRKSTPYQGAPAKTMLEKILFAKSIQKKVRNPVDHTQICPSCLWGPKVGFNDIVWNKLGTCSWWPARVLTPGEVPACLMAREHSADDWPLRYYGTLNHSWGSPNRTCLFLPSRAVNDPEDLKNAVMDAHDNYISLYLT